MAAITGADFITVFITDIAVAERFYGETLALECSARYEGLPGAEFETAT